MTDPGSPASRPAARDGAVAIGPPAAVALAFVGSGCLLILEIVAGRLLAPTLGVSLYTWTAVIGVVLAGVSLGNYLGGRLADRLPSRSVLALIYLAGSAASLLVLGLVRYLGSLELPSGAPAVLQVLWLTALLFLLPSTILGLPTPLLTRLSLRSVEEGGRVVGRIQAAAALGSIAGTFLTGFVLISALGTRWIVAGVAGTLLLLAAASKPPWLKTRVYELGSLLAVIVASGFASASGCLRESSYYCIRVEEVRLGQVTPSGAQPVEGRFRALYLDHLLHGVASLDDPTLLYYGYEQLYRKAVARLHPPGSRLDAFLIGGGAYSFPRYLEAVYRGRIVVAEIDPAVTEVARSQLGLSPSSRIEIHHADARRVLRALPRGERFDVVLGDAFNDYAVPYHLTTREFNELVARHLKRQGLYLLNIVDGVRFEFLRSEIRTLRRTFPYVGLMSLPKDWPPKPRLRTTYVLVAAKTPPARPLGTVPARTLAAFLASGRSVLLRDDHVPVDQLLAPVFAQALHSR